MAIEIEDFRPEQLFQFITEQSQKGNIDIGCLMNADNKFVYDLTMWLNHELRQKESDWAKRELAGGNGEFVSAKEAINLLQVALR